MPDSTRVASLIQISSSSDFDGKIEEKMKKSVIVSVRKYDPILPTCIYV